MAKTEKPSKEHLLFAETALRVFQKTFDQFGFEKHLVEIEKYSTTLLFKKGNQYVKISGSTYPKDYPYSYNVILGDGDSDDFWEYDWNSIALWRMKTKIDQNSKAKEYEFPTGKSVEFSLKNANQELVKYGLDFLKGELKLFKEVRIEQNKNREPYKIHTKDKNGNYKTTDEPRSVEQKKKYS